MVVVFFPFIAGCNSSCGPCLFLELMPEVVGAFCYFVIDMAHLAKEKAKADADFYRMQKETESNKVWQRSLFSANTFLYQYFASLRASVVCLWV